MKALLSLLAVTLLTGAFLYPLYIGGIGRPVSRPLVAVMATGGVICLWLLVKYRKRF